MTAARAISGFADDMVKWRHMFHREPELGYKEHVTARRVARLLGEFGVDEIIEGVGGTGVIGTIRGGSGPMVGLRAELDALPITEQSDRDYRSAVDGVMHACGHDGHMSMLLGAARYMSATRAFSGTVAVIFQPAEEGLAGAKAMLDDGLLERVPIESVFALHNMPGLPAGHIAISSGTVMAAIDQFSVTVEGKGGHAAMPHLACDPIPAAASIILSAQSLVSRNADPLAPSVVTVSGITSGEAQNAIPQRAELRGSVRYLDPNGGSFFQSGLERVVEGTAAAYGMRAALDYRPGRPPTVNDDRQAAFVRAVASRLQGVSTSVGDQRPIMASEDFSYFLQARPGAFAFLGVGEDRPALHSPEYDFNDDVLVAGAALLSSIAEAAAK
jgi:hippurate hydrolase